MTGFDGRACVFSSFVAFVLWLVVHVGAQDTVFELPGRKFFQIVHSCFVCMLLLVGFIFLNPWVDIVARCSFLLGVPEDRQARAPGGTDVHLALRRSFGNV